MQLVSDVHPVLRFAPLLLAGCALTPSVSLARNSGQWWLKVSAADKTYQVRPDGSGWHEVPHTASHAAGSPDGKHVVYSGYTTDVQGESKPQWHSEIFVANADGTNVRRLVNGAFPNWTPDSKHILFESGGQIHTIDLDGSRDEQLTHEEHGAHLPKFAPDGRLTYLALRKPLPQKPSVWFQDLIVRDGEISKPIAQNQLLYYDFAWSPDGKTIAYGKLGALVFHDLVSGKDQEIDYAKMIDPQLGSHATSKITWRPDSKAVACQCQFFGGRSENGPKILGDEEVFLIPRDGKPTWFKLQFPPGPAAAAKTEHPVNSRPIQVFVPEGLSLAWAQQK